MKVETILATKGRRVVTVAPDRRVADAVQTLRTEGVGALVVSEDGERIAGIVSERDIVLGLAREGAAILDRRVAQVMTKAVRTTTPEAQVKELMADMTRFRIRHLPVVTDGRLCGIVSIGDVVKNRLDETELEVQVLRDLHIARS